MTSRRRLIVMRHAKAEPFAATDHERALTDRGRRGASEAGFHLVEIGVVPDYAVVSTAARSVATWDAVALGSESGATVTRDPAVYNGSVDVVLEALRGVPPEAETVMFVGHNPTVAYVAHMLDDGNAEPVAQREMLKGYPAGAMAVFEVEVPWSDLGAESGRLIDFYVGHG